MVIVRTANLIIKKFYILPAFYLCFVWLSERTVDFSLRGIQLFVFITEMASVYYAGRTGLSNRVDYGLSLKA